MQMTSRFSLLLPHREPRIVAMHDANDAGFAYGNASIALELREEGARDRFPASEARYRFMLARLRSHDPEAADSIRANTDRMIDFGVTRARQVMGLDMAPRPGIPFTTGRGA